MLAGETFPMPFAHQISYGAMHKHYRNNRPCRLIHHNEQAAQSIALAEGGPLCAASCLVIASTGAGERMSPRCRVARSDILHRPAPLPARGIGGRSTLVSLAGLCVENRHVEVPRRVTERLVALDS